MNKNRPVSQRALKIWQLCANCEHLERDLPECDHIRAVEWDCERYECEQEGLQQRVEDPLSDATVTINHVMSALERPQSALLEGHSREELVNMIAKVMRFS